jgi:hypothetical protein
MISAKCTLIIDNGQTTILMPTIPNYGPKRNSSHQPPTNLAFILTQTMKKEPNIHGHLPKLEFFHVTAYHTYTWLGGPKL